MMAQEHTHSSKLARLSETGLVLANDNEDIRGREVVDRHGKKIGLVADLFIDEQERRIRMIQIKAGGFLGLGERHFLLPGDAITEVTKAEVHIDATLEWVIGSPAYDPHLIVAPEADPWGSYYGYYGVSPYWGSGYVYPGFPMPRREQEHGRDVRSPTRRGHA
jgi:sporulation protein YlmC with PRC-barrel domain